MITHRDSGADICTRDNTSDEHRRPYTEVRGLVAVECHISALEGKRVVARERIEQPRTRGECGHGGHKLCECDHGQAHERETFANGVVVELCNRNGKGRALNGRDGLHRKEEGEHVCETDEPGADNGADDSKWR